MLPTQPHMPQVDVRPNIEAIFRRVREIARAEPAAAASGGPARRQVVILTPGRLLMQMPCPAAGTISAEQVTIMEKLISPSTLRQVAVVGYTDLPALHANIGQAIPFMGLLLGLAYIGHAVWVFEGHASALEAGCREADVLIVDGGMVPFLPENWLAVAIGAMRRPVIYTHDRPTFSLKRVPTEV